MHDWTVWEDPIEELRTIFIFTPNSLLICLCCLSAINRSQKSTSPCSYSWFHLFLKVVQRPWKFTNILKYYIIDNLFKSKTRVIWELFWELWLLRRCTKIEINSLHWSEKWQLQMLGEWELKSCPSQSRMYMTMWHTFSLLVKLKRLQSREMQKLESHRYAEGLQKRNDLKYITLGRETVSIVN